MEPSAVAVVADGAVAAAIMADSPHPASCKIKNEESG